MEQKQTRGQSRKQKVVNIPSDKLQIEQKLDQQIDTQPNQQQQVDPQPVKKKRVPKEKPFDVIAAVGLKYQSAGWTAYQPKVGGINDLIASKGDKLHFVQVVLSTDLENMRYKDVAKNTFIQNATSNSAIPVYATITIAQRKGEPGPCAEKINFEDVNTKGRILITAKSPTK